MYGSAELLHLDGALDAGVDARLLEGVLQRQGVDHRGQHAHVVGVARSIPASFAGQGFAADLEKNSPVFGVGHGSL
jgi:hypothetical protein